MIYVLYILSRGGDNMVYETPEFLIVDGFGPITVACACTSDDASPYIVEY